ncbi:MAG: hypothetical protein WCC69_13330 [Pirellulales bacterium]
MATAPTSSESLAVGSWAAPGPEGSKSDRYLARRLAAAAADYKSVAVLTFLLAASVSGMLWLLAGIVLEHWVVPGGLPGWFRWGWLGVAAVALAAAVGRWVVPLLRYRVNLVYAARAIEADHPDLHNDLVNAVLVKAHADANAHAVVRTLERRAAKRLSAVPAEGVVDRGFALKLAIALAGLVAAACIYELAAPKSLLVSAARLIAPWAAVAPPARVRIDPPQLAWRHPGAAADAGGPAHTLDVIGGTVTVVRGRQLVVTSLVRGLDRDERAEVVVSRIRDNGALDTATPPWRVAMAADAEGRQMAILPDASRGLDHGLEFVITAGDATSDRLRAAVVDTPALLVREVKYDYPAYTRRPSETLAWQGDLRGVEGTRVTIIAEGNRPLDAAWIDLGCDGKKDVPLRISQHDLARATGSFSLRLNADRTGPAASSYRLGFVPRGSGASDREDTVLEKLEHRIEVTPDLAPEVTIEEPRQQVLRVPPDAAVTVRVRALDPDFALTRVAIETRLKGGESQPEIQVFRGEKSGVLKFDAAVVPAEQGASPGSVLEYRAVAIDNRPESPNVARTEWRSLEIDPDAPPPPAPRPDPSQKQRENQPQQNGGKQDNGKQEQQKPNEQPNGQRPDQQSGGGQEKGPQGAHQGAHQGGQQPGQQGAQGGQQGSQQEKGNQEKGNQAAPQDAGGGLQQSEKPQGPNGQGSQGKGDPAKNEQGKGEGGGEKQQPATQPQSGGGPRGQQREKNTVAHDGTNDGEALERLLDHRRQERGEQQDGGQQATPGQRQGQQQGQQSGQKAAQQGEQQQPQAGESSKQDGQSEQHQHADCRNADGKPCGKQGCPSCKGGAGQGQGQPKGQGSASGNGGAAGGGEAGQQQSGAKADAGDEGDGEAGQAAGGKPGQGKNAAGTPADTGKKAEGKESSQGQAAGDGKGAGQSAQQQPGNQKTENQGQGSGAQGQQAQNGKAAGQNDGASGQPGDAGDAQAGGKQMPPGNAVGAGGKGGGDQGAQADSPDAALPRKKMEWTDQDLAHARNAADLALEHLRDAVNGGKRDVLDALGWTPEQARAFLERWEAMRRQADTGDATAKGRFERTLQSLGLRPDGVRSSRDVPADAKGGQAEGRRSRPPADYRDQFRAFLQGTSVGNGAE